MHQVLLERLSREVVPPRDPDALAAALERLLGDPDLCARMGASARRRALAEFSRDAMMRGLDSADARARPAERAATRVR
ncbi:MAG: hypothetical protein A2V88_13620 [Elusimicrobia bacterium RBG_16_66_12]|nr:MAG: hypothetical protein A2V88_13620 [Elusimicrobia bacterium RBG_16_66_12]